MTRLVWIAWSSCLAMSLIVIIPVDHDCHPLAIIVWTSNVNARNCHSSIIFVWTLMSATRSKHTTFICRRLFISFVRTSTIWHCQSYTSFLSHKEAVNRTGVAGIKTLTPLLLHAHLSLVRQPPPIHVITACPPWWRSNSDAGVGAVVPDSTDLFSRQ